MKEMFQGVAVGGPSAGRWIANETDVFRVDTLIGPPARPSVRDPVPAACHYKTHLYRYRTFQRVGVWVHDELDDPAALMKELAEHYRPLG